jgi:hypothetical protein
VASKSWFTIRRRAWRHGHFQEECWGTLGGHGAIKGDWRPIGTLAAEAMRRYSVVGEVVGRSHTVARLLGGRARAVRVDPEMSPGDVAGLWRTALQAIVDGRLPPAMPWAGSVFPYWIAWTPPRGSAREIVQPFFLPVNAEAGAISLSAAFGMVSGGIWVCRECHQPFRRSSTTKVCPECQRGASLTTGAGLPASLKPVWRRFRKRLDLRVMRGQMVPQDRDRAKQLGLRALREVAGGRLALSTWNERWNQRRSRIPGSRPRQGNG